nr:MAG TPA: hypothetical protein [Caudoviricetes sp.]
MGTSKNVTWQEYNGKDYDVLLPQPSIATADRVGGIIAEEAEMPQIPGLEEKRVCKISPSTHKLLIPASINPVLLNPAVPVNRGGTGANDKQQALINLGVSDYVIGLDILDNREVFTYKSGRKVLTERRFNSSSINIQTQTDDRKWYKSTINTFTPSVSSIGNMNTWKYWNLQVVPVGSKDVLPMFVNLQTGYDPTSNSIPWRLFSTSSLIFNANQLLFLLTVIV